jgi:hypothetical protein
VGTKWQSIKKAQGAFGGGVMVVAAVALMWFGVSSDVSTDEQLDGLVKQSIEIDADNPDPNDNGKIVVAAASWSTTAGYEDEFLRLLGPLLVRRRVEMLQWVELREETSSAPTYSLEWVEGQVDFFSFQVPTGHENPLLRVSPISYQAEQSRFGGFDGGRLLKVITKLEPLTLAPELLKDQTTEISDNKLLLRRNQEMQLPSLGDTRVWYEILPQGDYTVLTVQQDERSLIGANPGSKLFIQRGLLNSNELLEKLGQHRRSLRNALPRWDSSLCWTPLAHDASRREDRFATASQCARAPCRCSREPRHLIRCDIVVLPVIAGGVV